ncbi:MAG TPA: hypothetical protein VH475_15530 [Tepidisphaeraceae bacterium]|jgi:outer membrane murein-binding lipoprotein Lpp
MAHLKHHPFASLFGFGIALAAVLCVLLFLGAGNGATAAVPDELTQLRADVAKLNERVAALEKEIAALKARPQAAGTITLVPTPTVPGAGQPVQPPGGLKMPQGSVEREFNGVRYYVVPLDRQPSPAETTPIAEPKH